MSKGIYTKAQEHLKEYSPRCCAIKDKSSIFIGMEYTGDALGVCINYYFPNLKNIWGVECKGGFYRSNCSIVNNEKEKNSFLLVGWKGDVFAQHGLLKSGKPNLVKEKNIPIEHNCTIKSIRTIAGKAYIVGAWHTVFRRDGVDNWKCILGNNPKEIELWQEQNLNLGFNDIGGFSENDIYACGGRGDLWHFNGKKWKELDIPTNLKLISLCCANDGKVYIGCKNGVLIQGRDDSWEVVKSQADKDILDMVWYKGKLYLACGMYGLYIYENETIKSASGVSTLHEMLEYEEGVLDKDVMTPASLHSLSTDGEILLLAGTDKVIAYNGKSWKVLYAPYPLDIGGELW